MNIGQASPRGFNSGGLDLGAALGETMRGLPHAWRGAWGAMLAFVAGVAVTIVLPELGGWRWVGGVAVLTAGLALKGALLRIALKGGARDDGNGRPMGLGPAGLQLGRPEARLLGAALLCLLLIVMIASVLGLALLAAAGMAELDADAIAVRNWAAAGAGWKLGVVALASAATVVIMGALVVRLCLYAPATVARGRMTSLDSLTITKGATWPLLTGLIATSTPVVVLAWLSSAGPLAGPADKMVWALGLAGLQAPLTIGFLSAAYRRLDGQ